MHRPRVKRTVILNWMFSYWIVLACALLTSVIVYAGAITALDREVRKVESATLKNLQTILDGRLQEVKAAAGLLQYDPDLLAFTHSSYPFYKPEIGVAGMRAKAKMVQAVQNTRAIDTIYLYSYRSRVFLSTAYGINEDTTIPFPSEAEFGLSPEELEGILTGDLPKFMILPPVSEGLPDQALVFLHVYSQGINPEGVLFLKLDLDRFLDQISGTTDSKSFRFLILDPNGRRISAGSGDVPATSFTYENLPGTPQKIKAGGLEALLSSVQSKVGDWKYVLLLDVKEYQAGIRTTRDRTVVAIFVLLLFGSLLSYLFARRNYSPIRRLLAQFSRASKLNEDRTGDEMQFLEQAVQKVIHEKDLYSKRLERQETTLRDALFVRLVKGRGASREQFELLLSEEGIHFTKNHFVVVLLAIEDFGVLLSSEEADPDVAEASSLSVFLLKNLFEEKFGEATPAHVFEVDDQVACLVNLPEEPKDGCGNTARVTEECLALLRGGFGVLVSAGVGSLQGSIHDLNRSFLDAQEALEYARLFETVGSVHCHAVREEGHDEAFPVANHLTVRRQLLNHLMAGDYRAVETLVLQLIDEDTEARQNPTILRMRQYSLLEDLLAALDELVAGQTHLSRKDADRILNEMITVSGKGVFRRLIREFLANLELLRDQKESLQQHDVKLNRIVEYIQSNLSDPDLSVTRLAEHVDLSVSQVTRLMRSKLGQGTLEYIQQCRIDLAKKLLSETELNVNDISKRVGYYNFRTMNSIFKKIEGVTGTQYREQIRSR